MKEWKIQKDVVFIKNLLGDGSCASQTTPTSSVHGTNGNRTYQRYSPSSHVNPKEFYTYRTHVRYPEQSYSHGNGYGPHSNYNQYSSSNNILWYIFITSSTKSKYATFIKWWMENRRTHKYLQYQSHSKTTHMKKFSTISLQIKH